MNWDVIENCVAIAAIACIAVFSKNLGLDSSLSSAAIAAIAGLAGHGVSNVVSKLTERQQQVPVSEVEKP